MKLIVLGLTCLILAGGCQEDIPDSYSITAELDTSYATIGDLVQLKIAVQGDLHKNITFPLWDLESPLEVRSIFKNAKEGSIIFNLVFWDTGRISIPSYTVEIFGQDSSILTKISSEPLEIDIISVVDMDPRLKKSEPGLKKVKDPVPISWSGDWIILIKIAVLILILTAIILISLKKREKSLQKEMHKTVIMEPADVIALNRLNALNDLKINNKKDVKNFYVLLSAILREYVENSLFIRTLEMTTKEIQNNENLFLYNSEEFKTLIHILLRADKVKYAQQYPDLKSCTNDLNQVFDLISTTRKYWILH